MSTSPHDGVYLYEPAAFGADRFVDTGLARDGVIGSALHKADSAAQPRASWIAVPAALWIEDTDPFLVPFGESNGVLNADTWYPIPLKIDYCPKVRASGKGYRLRVWIAGRSSAGHDCDFQVIVAPQHGRLFEFYGVPDPAWDSKTYSNVTSTTVAALTSDDANRYMDVSVRTVNEALEREGWSTLDDIGGNSIAIRAPMLEVIVLARTANVSSTPELYGVSVAEVIGDT
jgi:hypothetical protein